MKRILIASGNIYTKTNDDEETEMEIGNQDFGRVAEQLWTKLFDYEPCHVDIYIKIKE